MRGIPWYYKCIVDVRALIPRTPFCDFVTASKWRKSHWLILLARSVLILSLYIYSVIFLIAWNSKAVASQLFPTNRFVFKFPLGFLYAWKLCVSHRLYLFSMDKIQVHQKNIVARALIFSWKCSYRHLWREADSSSWRDAEKWRQN